MSMNYGPVDFVGNIGVVVLVVTYLMLQLNKLSSDGLAYSVLNAVGAGLIVVSLLFDFNLSALVIEVFWVLISFVGIYRYFRLKALRSQTFDG
jgi:multisubunit Na+/H+ antiporter MnhB subunit